jgi:molybdenum cofactor cytidylyltransferase
MHCLGVLLAAGVSRRFGPQDKLLAPYRGAELVRAAATALLGAGCDAVLAIVSSVEVAGALPAGIGICRVASGRPLADSFRAAIDQALEQQAGRLLVCLGDMPNVTPALLRRLVAYDASCACRAGAILSPPMLLAAADYGAARASADGDRGGGANSSRRCSQAL